MDESVNAINPIYDVLIHTLRDHKVSDFHIHAGRPVQIRETGDLLALEFVATNAMIANLIKTAIGDEDFAKFEESGDVDFALEIEGQRFRVSGYRQMHGFAMVLRVIVSEVPHIDMLGLPPAVHEALNLKSGLVLVTGQTGSGKSTSLAAMIDKINRERSENIITIEDPIEFVHSDLNSIITQREVGADTQSFSSALRSALRQDPDIILMGELRDYETVSMAMTAAETGHLVFGTLHTSGAPETINRIIDVFPAEEQNQARSQLSQSLRLVITQQLVKRRGGGRIAAFEVMVCVPAVANLIRERKIVQIQTIMQTGHQYGMVTMEKYMEILQAKKLIA